MGISSQSLVQFRIYSDGTILHESKFKYTELGIVDELPYTVVTVPQLVVEHIEDTTQGK